MASAEDMPEAAPVTDSYSVSTPTSRGQFARFCPPETLADLSGEYVSDDGTFDFFRIKRRFSFDSSSSDDTSNKEYGGESRRYSSIKSYVYIDDFNAVETVDLKSAISHITMNKCKLRVRAGASENLFKKINDLANNTGMQVNHTIIQIRKNLRTRYLRN